MQVCGSMLNGYKLFSLLQSFGFWCVALRVHVRVGVCAVRVYVCAYMCALRLRERCT
jgi:hypothetical protein